MDDINRYVFCKGSAAEYLLDTKTGDMWEIQGRSSNQGQHSSLVIKPILKY